MSLNNKTKPLHASESLEINNSLFNNLQITRSNCLRGQEKITIGAGTTRAVGLKSDVYFPFQNSSYPTSPSVDALPVYYKAEKQIGAAGKHGCSGAF